MEIEAEVAFFLRDNETPPPGAGECHWGGLRLSRGASFCYTSSTMQKLKLSLLIFASVVILFAVIFFLLGYLKPKGAGILVETNPASTVFIDGNQVGRTPYEATRSPGEISVKLVPETLDKPASIFETKVTLNSGIKTVIKREFGETEETSAGEIISFERAGGKEASLVVVSVPDAAQVSIDGQVRGFAPYKTSSVTAGEHQVAVSALKFSERNLSVKVIPGYKLTAVVKLAQTPQTQESQEEKKVPLKRTMVEILSTPTGFLRVRSEPGLGGREVGRVDPGAKFVFLEEDAKTGWYKIEFEKDKEGWVTNQYAKKTEEEVSQ